MPYRIAQLGQLIGHAASTLRVEINLGLQKGYQGSVQDKQEVLDFITGLHEEALKHGANFITFVVSETVLAYAYDDNGHARTAHEPGLCLKSDKSPLYAADISDDDWKVLVESYAQALGEHFEQEHVFVTYLPSEIKVLQRVDYLCAP
jgi:hypothetical protein